MRGTTSGVVSAQFLLCRQCRSVCSFRSAGSFFLYGIKNPAYVGSFIIDFIYYSFHVSLRRSILICAGNSCFPPALMISRVQNVIFFLSSHSAERNLSPGQSRYHHCKGSQYYGSKAHGRLLGQPFAKYEIRKRNCHQYAQFVDGNYDAG